MAFAEHGCLGKALDRLINHGLALDTPEIEAKCAPSLLSLPMTKVQAAVQLLHMLIDLLMNVWIERSDFLVGRWWRAERLQAWFRTPNFWGEVRSTSPRADYRTVQFVG